MMKNKFCSFLLFALQFFVLYSCKPQEPGADLQSSDMEDILYDYHLADAMAEEANNGNSVEYNKAFYRDAVLKKHGVTQAQFDSSLVYYTRHADKLHDIYDNLSKRFSNAALALGSSVTEINRYGGISSSADTTNVWRGDAGFVLMPETPYSQTSFEIEADTAYHKGDRLILSFDCNVIFRDVFCEGVALIAIQLTNDSIVSSYVHMSSSSNYSVTVTDESGIGIKAVRGFFCMLKSMNYNPTSLQLISVSNIRLVRNHVASHTSAGTSSSASSATGSDAVGNRPSAEEPQMKRKVTDISPVDDNNQPRSLSNPSSEAVPSKPANVKAFPLKKMMKLQKL